MKRKTKGKTAVELSAESDSKLRIMQQLSGLRLNIMK